MLHGVAETHVYLKSSDRRETCKHGWKGASVTKGWQNGFQGEGFQDIALDCSGELPLMPKQKLPSVQETGF